MSQPTTILSVEECFAILQQWRKDGLTEEERNDFVTRASRLLTDSDMVNEFLRKISESGKLGGTIDEAMRHLAEIMVSLWPGQWITVTLSPEWEVFRERYREIMLNSTVNSKHIGGVIFEFDRLYLGKVEDVQTEQDRIAAMEGLEHLIVDLDAWDKSPELVKQFMDLKRDIEEFVNRFTVAVEKNAIVPLTNDIEALDAQIIAAQKSIGVLGGDGILRALGLGAKASNVIASLQYHRDKKAGTLKDLHGAVTAFKELVASPVEASERLGQAPNLDVILNGIVVFAEIWSSIRSQCVQFGEVLGRGLEAATNSGFKSQVKMARQLCTPLIRGLEEYNKQVWSWMSPV